MGLLGFLKSRLIQPTDMAGMVAAYQRLRAPRLRLNNELVRRLSRDALDEGAKKLGILRRGVFVFDNEDQSSVLMDYCIYDVYRRGRNAIDEYLRVSPPDPDSDEMACLSVMRQAKYAMVIVTCIEPGVGCHIRDLFMDESRLLVDIGFSRTAQPGLLLATRLLDFGNFVTTTGAALPLGVLNSNEMDAWQRKLSTGLHSDRADPAPLIRTCLQRGASSYVRYEDSVSSPWSEDREESPPAWTSVQQTRTDKKHRAGQLATNRRCRCGSGKMFKNCCGKRGKRPEERR